MIIVSADVDYEIVAKHLETHTPTYTAIYPGRIKIIETPPAESSTPRPKKVKLWKWRGFKWIFLKKF